MNAKIAVLFPVTLAAAMAVFFGWFAFHYRPIVDDLLFLSTMKTQRIPEAAMYFYNGFNGRLASHFFLCTVFRIFSGRESLFFIYHFLLLAAFVFSLSSLLRNYLRIFRQQPVSFRTSFLLSLFITAFFFFFFFEGRVETWFWVSATGVHLLSLLLGMTGFSVLLHDQNDWRRISAALLIFFLAGGFSESFALLYAGLLLLLLLRKTRIRRPAVIAALAGIAGGILLNILSPGIHTRLGWLPDFRLLQAIKNTFHAMALPFLRWKHLPVKLLLIAGLALYAKWRYGIVLRFDRELVRRGLVLLAFIFAAFFLPSFILSDVAPDRTTSIGYLAGVLFLFDRLVFPGVGKEVREL